MGNSGDIEGEPNTRSLLFNRVARKRTKIKRLGMKSSSSSSDNTKQQKAITMADFAVNVPKIPNGKLVNQQVDTRKKNFRKNKPFSEQSSLGTSHKEPAAKTLRVSTTTALLENVPEQAGTTLVPARNEKIQKVIDNAVAVDRNIAEYTDAILDISPRGCSPNRNSDTVDQDEDITKELQDGDLFVKVGDQFIEVPIESLGMDVAAGYKTNDMNVNCLNANSVGRILLGISEDLKTIIHNQNTFDVRIRGLENFVNNVSREENPASSGPHLPLDSLEKLDEAEEVLTYNKTARSATVRSLSLLGGLKLEDSITVIMRTLMTKELRLKFNAKRAQHGKLSFQSRDLYGVVLEAIRIRYPEVTDREVILVIGRILTSTPDECGGREARRQRSAFVRAAKNAAMIKFDLQQNKDHPLWDDIANSE